MKKTYQQTGRWGENIAEDYLKEQGYLIVARNVRYRAGEIDLIALDGDVVCFIEVKTRGSDEYGSPFEAIAPSKTQKLFRMAALFLQEMNWENRFSRFDIVGIVYKEDDPPSIELLKNAFEGPSL